MKVRITAIRQMVYPDLMAKYDMSRYRTAYIPMLCSHYKAYLANTGQ